MDQVKFVHESFFKILLGPLLNTFTHLLVFDIYLVCGGSF